MYFPQSHDVSTLLKIKRLPIPEINPMRYRVTFFYLDGKTDCDKSTVVNVEANSLIDAMNLVHNSTEASIQITNCQLLNTEKK